MPYLSNFEVHWPKWYLLFNFPLEFTIAVVVGASVVGKMRIVKVQISHLSVLLMIVYLYCKLTCKVVTYVLHM